MVSIGFPRGNVESVQRRAYRAGKRPETWVQNLGDFDDGKSLEPIVDGKDSKLVSLDGVVDLIN